MKKINLDDPYGLNYDWADLKRDDEMMSHRQNLNKGIMVYGFFSSSGRPKIVECDQKIDANYYMRLLRWHFLPFMNKYHADGGIWQQDGDPPHATLATRQFISESDLDLMVGPPQSPDLNLIEHVWGVLARQVYSGCKECTSLNDLREAIRKGIRNISKSYLRD